MTTHRIRREKVSPYRYFASSPSLTQYEAPALNRMRTQQKPVSRRAFVALVSVEHLADCFPRQEWLTDGATYATSIYHESPCAVLSMRGVEYLFLPANPYQAQEEHAHDEM